MLFTFRFQPSPLASKLRAAPLEGEQNVSLPLPVYSLAKASPVRCLLVVAGVTECRESARATFVQLNRRKRRKLPTPVKADEVVQHLCDRRKGENSQRLGQWMRSHNLYFVPTVDQTEEEKTPKGCEVERGHIQVYMTQRWNRQKRRKLPMAVKADDVV